MNARWLAISIAGAPLLLAASDATAACDQDQDCSGGPARIMLVVDASSDTLNVGNEAGGEGLTAWDVIREVVAGEGEHANRRCLNGESGHAPRVVSDDVEIVVRSDDQDLGGTSGGRLSGMTP
jgi:hypothetical protein